MEALASLLTKKEFEDVSVQEIADEATLNRATFYLHYPDKNALLQAMTGVRFRDLIERARLPWPMFNARLLTADGDFIASPDAWWSREGVAVEIDSREWHLNPADWERTMRRHARISAHGILVLHFSPRQIRTSPARVIATIRETLAAGAARPVLRIIARPAAA